MDQQKLELPKKKKKKKKKPNCGRKAVSYPEGRRLNVAQEKLCNPFGATVN